MLFPVWIRDKVGKSVPAKSFTVTGPVAEENLAKFLYLGNLS